MKLISLVVIAANAIAIANAGNISWKDLDTEGQYSAGVAILQANKQISTQGVGGCAITVAGCIGAALGSCFCVAGPQAAVCTTSGLPNILGGFFTSTFTSANYECNDIPLRGHDAKTIRCKAAKVWMANLKNNIPGNAEMIREYSKCFEKVPVCKIKECWRSQSIEM
ncbi:hypothetical protein BGW38_000573 [Lunasporangiospora selenospora]|uniref:Uncharacterized protein n=1 Tax=Lunasporangiospora selenospora TaxID=979761 RepID=A0A9P6FVH0_9FUNG|nr:hypothetical protein BGW38_000573 [Lunasporangiospora selenospora]